MGVEILIVDDHEIVRDGVRSLIKELRPEWQICGEATNGSDAIEMVRNHKPDVVVLDIVMPNMTGFEAASRISQLGLGCRVLLFTMHESGRLTAEARRAGAQGYVLKSQASRHLILAIDRLLAGKNFFSRAEDETESEEGPAPTGGLRFCLGLGLCAA